jgi:hypothetical protein
MIKIDSKLTLQDLKPSLNSVFEVAAGKIKSLHQRWNVHDGAPVFTINGKYTARGWTEWTQGFQFGMSILQYDITGEKQFLEMGRSATVEKMASHVSHFGVHDHGFNNVSTYGNLLRLQNEGRLPSNEWEKNFYEIALKMTGAVQAARWTDLPHDKGYIYSFNGPHSLFADTVRSLRALVVSHQLGHCLMGERDRKVSLLKRVIQHAETTSTYNVFFGEGRDSYDVRGRVAHESIFNLNDGSFRSPNSQQGYSPFTTWTRGLAWILCGYPEQLEYLFTLPDSDFKPFGGKKKVFALFEKTALAVADFYLENTPVCGVPYWDTGAPSLHKLGNYLDRPAEPFNAHEPVDSSAAAISAQGLYRLGRYLKSTGRTVLGNKYTQAALTVSKTLLSDLYISRNPKHEGLLLHSVYHQPNGWDQVHKGQKVPNGEACMWGDYHLLELAVLLKRDLEKKPYYKFYL